MTRPIKEAVKGAIKGAIKGAVKAVCLLSLSAGIVWNVRFTIADCAAERRRPEATRLAMRLMPADPVYPAQLADEVFAMDPATAKSLLQEAVKLNRYDAPSWIRLGLLSEAADELPQAEEALLQAAKVDAAFLPSWSLAGFYFRHRNPDRFWYWAQRAAQMAPDSATPLLRLAWYMSPNVGEVERRLHLTRPAIAVQLVDFLVAQGDADAAAEAATHLLAANTGANTQALLRVCDWLVANQHAGLALPLWNGLAAHGEVPYAHLGAVTNGSFSRSPLSKGFDWHLQAVEGVSSFLNVNPNELGFEFSGTEPDNFLLMNQTASVQAQKNYALAIAYSTAGIAPESGIAWQVTDPRSGAVLATTGSLAAEQEGHALACFAVPAGDSFVDLELAYRRQPGTVRVEGKLALRAVQLLSATPHATLEPCAGKKISPLNADSVTF